MSKHAMTDPDARKNPAPKKAKGGKKDQQAAQNPLAQEPGAGVTSDQQATTPAAGMEPGSDRQTTQAAGMEPAAPPAKPARSMTMADLKLVRSKSDRKSKRLVVYNIEGRTGSVQFLSTLFGGDQKSVGNPPESLTLSGEFAEPKAAKPAETKEERKARLAALPKPTLAEKVAKAEERAQALREKLAKAAAVGQPAAEGQAATV